MSDSHCATPNYQCFQTVLILKGAGEMDWRNLASRTKSEEQTLRHVEKDVLIPKLMREKAKELCSDKVQAFTKCCQDTGVLMVVKCQEENKALKACLTGYYTDPAFYEECKLEYLKQREEFRATGIPQKQQKLPTSM
ncbi:COX assembly mitochondrial protein homolog isoform X4 [Varanus komodoensis]|uniref:COX assembly mitochondrial protein homolog isoform X4 n=1 Tax=Varanus komodoensis TaxID=61221 RepID=UPI001CF7A3F8|nr:COX assembly mitochondrial protein homolog isoform X4 [Varanus komodoensis]